MKGTEAAAPTQESQNQCGDSHSAAGSAITEQTNMFRRFQGCLFGALAGDCLGAPWEGCSTRLLRNRVIDLINETCMEAQSSDSSQIAMYTDDTAMAHDICASLIECNGFEPSHTAKRFAGTYFNGPHRGYGPNVREVFEKLHRDSTPDPFKPAREQFGGTGSYGNGGAMRVAPVALFYAHDRNKMLEVSLKQCQLTHTHPHGIMGSMLQAVAVFTALHTPAGELKADVFLKDLHTACSETESEIYGREGNLTNVYKSSLNDIQRLLDDNADEKRVASELGNNIRAHESVPAAIFSFLKCLQPFENYEDKNPLIRTLTYAICLGGDTDTIATMAGAIAGAYYGSSFVPDAWRVSECQSGVFEGAKMAESYAKTMYERYATLTKTGKNG